MSINMTLIGQAITFMIFVGFTMKFVWPHIVQAMQEREQKIADGLAAGERGHYELKRAQEKVAANLQEAREKAQHILNTAHVRAQQVIEDAEVEAKHRGSKILANAEELIAQERMLVVKDLQQQAANLSILCAKQILKDNINPKVNDALIDSLLKEERIV